MRERRGDLIGAALADGGKTIGESDPEVSEAIDFVEFYSLTALELHRCGSRGLGTIVVVSPWNFPIAIPCGGIASATAAGNTVILKPASDTVLPARILCECFWEAGVSRSALQLVPCSGRLAGEVLLADPRVDAVILTGGTSTAQHMLSRNPALKLLAETGGKNATIVSALSDHDLAIKNVVHSAFSHAGQKCSATSSCCWNTRSITMLASVIPYWMLSRASKSVSAWSLSTKVGPLIRPPTDALLRGLKELEAGESWAVMPRMLHNNPCLYSPGIKWDVAPGSFTHLTELFGPVLAVLPYRNLNEAIDLVHQTGYGLTSGLESLDDREQELWMERMRAGNLYINRPTTGAIVLRQPFGGLGKSAFGPGIKAGGPNYVLPLMHHTQLTDADASPTAIAKEDGSTDLLRDLSDRLNDESDEDAQALKHLLGLDRWQVLLQLMQDYDRFAREEIAVEHDTLRLIGQDNLRIYLPLTHLRIRVCQADQPLDVLARIIAARAAGGRAVVSASRASIRNFSI